MNKRSGRAADVRELRKRLGDYSQRDFARIAKVSPALVGAWETGKITSDGYVKLAALSSSYPDLCVRFLEGAGFPERKLKNLAEDLMLKAPEPPRGAVAKEVDAQSSNPLFSTGDTVYLDLSLRNSRSLSGIWGKPVLLEFPRREQRSPRRRVVQVEANLTPTEEQVAAEHSERWPGGLRFGVLFLRPDPLSSGFNAEFVDLYDLPQRRTRLSALSTRPEPGSVVGFWPSSSELDFFAARRNQLLQKKIAEAQEQARVGLTLFKEIRLIGRVVSWVAKTGESAKRK